LFCLVLFFFRCGANFLRSGVELEVAATQTLEFANEVFCAVLVQTLEKPGALP
jgi:hypothetical protein